jgi:hypothetical protein
MLSEKGIPLRISQDAIRQAMLSTVHLDHEALTEASEVNNVISDRGLSAEMMSEWL